jgi:ferric-dicitrate binding protein FerR (iron transport regulator)
MTEDFDILLEKFLVENISPEELKRFLVLSKDPANEIYMADSFRQKLENKEYVDISKGEDLDAMFVATMEKANQYKVKRLFPFKRIAVAASLIFLLGLAAFLYFNKDEKPLLAVQPTIDIAAPVSTKAVITLSDGQRVSIDSLVSINEGGTLVSKTSNGQIVYEGESERVSYNTLVNPVGSKVVSLILNDGTQVWLNTGSSLKYPTSFPGQERKVEITGEAYFEVAKDPSKKFFVEVNGIRTEVLGTHFNINGFIDNGATLVTLLEGSLKVQSTIIKPGEQAIATNGNVRVSDKADLEKVMAWKNNEFIFVEENIAVIMSELARWYDAKVEYVVPADDHHYTGRISRDVPLSKVLEMFEKIGYVSFEIKDKTIQIKKPGVR